MRDPAKKPRKYVKRTKKIETDPISRKITEGKVIKALSGTGGILSTVAKRLGVTWATADAYVKKWPSTITAFNDERELIKDMAESTIVNAIKSGDVGSARWMLSTLARARGYGDSIEVSGPGGGPIGFRFVDPPTPDTE